MFNLFQKKVSAVTDILVAEPKVKAQEKSVNEIIEEIHENFYTEVDRLLTSARISHSLHSDKEQLIEKCSRLKSLGFTNTKEVKEAEAEISRLQKLMAENDSKASLIEAIEYFSVRYSNYKFITEDSVKKICAKYNLVYGEISRYIGTVPDKNLKHIEDFKISKDDECYISTDYYNSFGIGSSILKKEYQTHKEHLKTREQERNSQIRSMYVHSVNEKCPLEIVAPLKDFNMDGMELKDSKLSKKIEIPDPVVLKPVIFKGQKHYLIVTAWGIEAADELVVNPNHN